jgi:hypothetical protein
MTSEVVRIRIGGHDTGIIGLKETLQEVSDLGAGLSDDALVEALLSRVGSRNYIPPDAHDKYATALLREYRKFVGLPVEVEAEAGPPEILVVGPGCARCDGLEKLVMEVLIEIELPARLEHVRDPGEIARMGIVGVPALVINGKVKCTGSVPPRGTVKAWLMALKQS